MRSAVIAFSGGLDSTTLLFTLLKNTDRIHAVFFEYGGRHNAMEYAAAKKILGPWGGIAMQRVVMPSNLFKGSSYSPLLDNSPMPHMTYEKLAQTKGPSPTVVPFRNANIISICAAIAAAQDYDEVYIATHSTDAHNWAYPDCSPEFLGAMMNAVYVGTYARVRLVTPFTWMTKGDIVALALKIGVPVKLTRSCYEASEIACGECPTCVERIKAFQDLGYADPVDYQVEPDWFGCKPWPLTESMYD